MEDPTDGRVKRGGRRERGQTGREGWERLGGWWDADLRSMDPVGRRRRCARPGVARDGGGGGEEVRLPCTVTVTELGSRPCFEEDTGIMQCEIGKSLRAAFAFWCCRYLVTFFPTFVDT